MTTGPRDPAGAGRGRLRAGHADREQVIEALKSAFVDGRLTKSELAARTGRALKARTYAGLAALTADLPAEPATAELLPAVPATAAPATAEAATAEAATAEPATAEPASAAPAGPPAPVIRRPMARAAAISGTCLAVAVAAMRLAFYFDPESGPPGPSPDQSWAKWCVLLAFIAVVIAAFALMLGAATSVAQRRSRRQLPPRPGSPSPGPPKPGPGSVMGGEHQRGTGHDPLPPSHRADETRADSRPHKSRQRGRGIPVRTGRAPGGVRPAPGAA